MTFFFEPREKNVARKQPPSSHAVLRRQPDSQTLARLHEICLVWFGMAAL